MNKLLKKIIAAVALISMAVSSMAAEANTAASSPTAFAHPAPLIAPIVLSQRIALNPVELTKYQQLSVRSQDLATRQVAGASDTTKTVVITVGVAIVILGVVAMRSYHGPDYHHVFGL